MTSKKFIPKNLREPISCYEEATWHANGLPRWETEVFSVWDDLFPVTPGHLLWIPKENTVPFVRVTYGEAYEYGLQQVEQEEWSGFNIGQNIGMAAGQSVMWPHVHLIPRHQGDCPAGLNGIRRSHPNGDHKEYY